MRTPSLRVSLTVFITLAATAPACADMGAPGMHDVPAIHRVTARESFPDYVYVIYRPPGFPVKDEKTGKLIGRATEAEFVELTPECPIVFTVTDTHYVALLIVPRTVAAQYRTPLEVAEAVFSMPDTVGRNYSRRELVPQWRSSEITIDYEVKRDAEGRLQLVRTTRHQGYQCCIVAIALPVATLLGGVWMIRRWRRRRSPPPA